MKRKMLVGIIMALAAALMLVALAGCGTDPGKQAAIDAFRQASTVTSKAKAVSYDTSYDLTANYSGFKFGATGNAKMAYSLPDDLADIAKAQLALDFTCNLDAIVDEMNMTVGAYLKNGVFYMALDSDQADAPSKVSFTVPKELGDMIGQAMKALESSGYDLNDLGKLMQSSGSTSGIDPKALDVSKFVTKGSFQNGEILLDIDIWGYVKQVMTISMRQQGMELDEALKAMKAADDMIKNCNLEIRAMVDGNMAFTSLHAAIVAKVDLSAAVGSMGGAGLMGLGGNMEMDVNATIDCPKILLNDAVKVTYPSLEGYEDITDQIAEGFNGMLGDFGSLLGSGLLGGGLSDLGGTSTSPLEDDTYDFDLDMSDESTQFEFDYGDYEDFGGMTDEDIEKMLKEYGVDVDVDMEMGTGTGKGTGSNKDTGSDSDSGSKPGTDSSRPFSKKIFDQA